jgi:imidazoleglycerol-phosphate dehydratase
MPARKASRERTTSETTIHLALDLDGSGAYAISTGVGFFDHMLSHVAKHGLIDLDVSADGDLHVDSHHLVEDVGIVLGEALAQAAGDKAGIVRYGHALVPMDEALVLVALDLSGRPFTAVDVAMPQGKVGEFDTELLVEFLRALAVSGGITLHVQKLAGTNCHHILEATFKALGRALDMALRLDPRRGDIPSTKGVL